MRNLKILSALLLVICLFTACGEEKKSPADDIKLLTQAILQDDKEAMKKFYVDVAEMNFAELYGDAINKEAGNLFSKEQANRIGAAVVNALKKIQFSVEDGKIDGDKATVSVTVDKFSQFNESDVTSRLPADMQTQSPEAQMEILTKTMVDAVNAITTNGKATFTVDCVYNENIKMWVPTNPTAFGFTLTSTIVGQ